MPLQDVQVTIDVKYPAPRVGLGRPLILSKKAGELTYKEYYTIEGVLLDYAKDTVEYEKAKTVFAQQNRPDVIAIATYATDPTETLELVYKNPWHWALVANDLPADQLKAATFFGGKKFKFGVYQVKTAADRAALKGKERAVVVDHDIVGEHMDAALVGELGSQPVGYITWKFKSLAYITPRYLTENEMALIDADYAIAYVMKAGKAQTSEGTLANGEFIDVLHGQDWVKADMENEIQHVLQNSKKLPYDVRGINSLVAAATTTLKRAFNNGIVAIRADGLPDFIVSALPRELTDPQDRNERVYRGLSFEFGNAGSIHAVRVKGSIVI